jgi:DNA helicase-2/ATP-dependent DNA helicase PcrA
MPNPTQPHSLNSAQRGAVESLSGPVLVLAGAGTGKTRVVTYRIANLIRNGIKPEQILAVTFTKKAAKEMQQRVAQLLGNRTEKSPLICTFHSFCVRVLRRHIETLGFPRKFVILDRGDQESHVRAALREIQVSDQALSPGDALWFISRWKSHGILAGPAERQADSDREFLAARAFARYTESLRQAGALDFDDLLLFTERLFREHPEKRSEEAGRWRHVLIDEYQDTNGEQYKIVRHLTGGHRNLCVVGDDDQSIYAWRGAQVQHILNFREDWPDATVIRLEENYRSTAEILQFANRLIEHNRQRHAKKLRPMRSGGVPPRILQMADEIREAADVVREIRTLLQRPEVQPCDIAILFRTNEQPRPFETELRKVRVPYVLIGGMSFFDRKEVKDILAYFRLIDNPRDEMAARRIINTPPRGIGKTTIAQVAEASLREKISFWEALYRTADSPSSSRPLPSRAAATILNEPGQAFSDPKPDSIRASHKGIRQFIGLIEQARREMALRPQLVEWATGFIGRLGYRTEIDRLYPEPTERESRWASVEQIVSALGQYVAEHGAGANLTDFLDEVAVGDQDIDNEKEKQLARNAVMLLTLHSAKGLEFPYVYMVGMEEGILPHQRSVDQGGESIDEERRLCYVGVTRAQEQLTLSMALTRMKWGKPRDARPSRFLYELTDQTSNPNYLEFHGAAEEPTTLSARPSETQPKHAGPAKAIARNVPKSKLAGGRSRKTKGV